MTAAAAGRAVLVTGGGTGIGFAAAAELHRRGWHVLLAGRRRDVLQAAVAALAEREAPGRAEWFRTDVLDPADCAAVVEAAVDRLGRLDALVHSAGDHHPETAFLDITAEAIEQQVGTQLRGTILVASHAAGQMVRQGEGGRIVLIGSIAALQAEPLTTLYAAAKAGVHAVGRAMAFELAEHGIVVNVVAPGWVRTPLYQDQIAPEVLQRLNPAGRIGEPEEIGGLVGFLIDEAPAYLTGQAIVVDGGQTIQAALIE